MRPECAAAHCSDEESTNDDMWESDSDLATSDTDTDNESKAEEDEDADTQSSGNDSEASSENQTDDEFAYPCLRLFGPRSFREGRRDRCSLSF